MYSIPTSRFVLPLVCIICISAAASAQHAVVEDAQPTPAFNAHDRIETPAMSFLVIGDWGGSARELRMLAATMTARHAQDFCSAVFTTGGNFLDAGVAGMDDPQWESKFESVFDAAAFPVPFWAVLGMADIKGDADAQIAYSGAGSNRWKMPARNWSTVFSIGSATLQLRVTGIDTPGLLSASEGDRARRLAWIDSVLASSTQDLHLVIGHHPVYSNGRNGNTLGMIRHVKPLLEKHHIDAYVSGRDNDVQILEPVNGVHYLICGASTRVRDSRWTANTRYVSCEPGFLWVQIGADAILVQVIRNDGRVLYSVRL